MNGTRVACRFCICVLLGGVQHVQAQRAQLGPRDPHIGYIYPAGGKAGTTLDVTVGGENIEGVTGVRCSGGGVRATVGKYHRPLNQGEAARLRQKLQDARERLQGKGQAPAMETGPFGARGMFQKLAKEAGISTEQLMALEEFRKSREDPKKQVNPAIAETLTFKIELAPDAAPGVRELRLVGPDGLSNPLAFHVGELPEVREAEPNQKSTGTAVPQALPFVLNGQILPGDVDRFSFRAVKGQRLVAVASARELVPHLADAVPGWFQATLALYDARGSEVSYADDYRFDPDPVLSYEIPEDGIYVLEVKDAIYRGRDDFVYRVTVGAFPFVTGIFPLGGSTNASTTVQLTGWNLPSDHLTIDGAGKASGLIRVAVGAEQRISHSVPFAVDALPECGEAEPNDEAGAAQRLRAPVIVNGRIDRPGDRDIFAVECGPGGEIVAEVMARRLSSPLDSMIKVTDSRGNPLGANDDEEDKAAPMVTHHADSLVRVKAPAAGTYLIHLGDTQRKGGAAFAYRLHINTQQPDFALRVVPSCVNVRAGSTVPVTVHVLRKNGFAGDVTLALRDAPVGFTISGGCVPAGQDTVRFTVTAPATASRAPMPLSLEGRATIGGREVRHDAVPAEDMMQAFAYHHLVPAKEWLVDVTERPGFAGGGMGMRPPEGGRFRRAFPGGGSRGFDLNVASVPPPAARPVKLPAGGAGSLRMPAPAGLSYFAEGLQVSLSQPPEGIGIQKFTSDRGGVDVVLSAEAGKVKPGLRGNLIFDVFVERTPPAPDGKARPNKMHIPLGTLPAVPFEIVER